MKEPGYSPLPGLVLRDLRLPARLVLALFMISVGTGYISALVNLHFQEASPGSAMPSLDDVVASYHGKTKQSQFVRLLEASDTAPFNGQGSMRSAFTRRAPGQARALKEKRKALNSDPKREIKLVPNNPDHDKLVHEAVMQDFNGERISLILWASYDPETTSREKAFEKIKAGYDQDLFVLPEDFKELRITEKYVIEDEGKPRAVKVKSIIEDRCIRCHAPNVSGSGSNYPLENWEDVSHYLQAEAPTGKSLEKLALSTHVHLLGFSVLYGLTGLVFAFSSYPGLIRLVIAPLPLLAQLIDISFWWLARLDPPYGPQFAQAIVLTGAIVGVSLTLQILLTLFDLFGKAGKLILVLLIAAGLVGGYYVKTTIIDKHLEGERTSSTARM